MGNAVAVKTEKTKYSPGELAEFKVIIDEKLKGAKEELQEAKDTLGENGSHGEAMDSGEASLDTETRELYVRIKGNQEKFILGLNNALKRIENGTYGVCRVTGKLISKDRLRIVPHATLSMEAKKVAN